MTFRARKVLDDCQLALELLEQSPDDQFWRVHWFAAVALVRTVGDVLHKVDALDPKYRTPVREAFQKWKSDREGHRIFWEFIKNQRDKLVHEYDSDVHPLDKASIVVEYGLVPLGGGDAKKVAEVFELDENIYRPMLSGPWEGDDGRDVLQEAIEWWKVELDEIEKFAGAN